MKRILVVLALLLAAIGLGYSVSGKVFVRFSEMPGNVSGVSYDLGWGNDGPELGQVKPGTGFELNFDKWSLYYRMMVGQAVPYLTSVGGSTGNTATTPGYFKFSGLELGPINKIGVMWHQILFGKSSSLTTNYTTGLVGNYTEANLTYNKVYLNFALDQKIGDNLEIKTYDWQMAEGNFDIGNSFGITTNVAGTTTNDSKFYYSYWVNLPIHFLLSLDALNIDIAPVVYLKSIYQQDATAYSTTNKTWSFGSPGNRLGGNISGTLGLDDVFSIYGSVGYCNDFKADLSTTEGATVTTNSDSEAHYQQIPAFLGLKIAMGGGIKMIIGYGYDWVFQNQVITYAPGRATATTNDAAYSYPRYGYSPRADEHGNISPNLMDLSFLRFDGTAKFAQFWELHLACAVSLFDTWDFGIPTPANFPGGRTTITPTQITIANNSQVAKFMNFVNWDRGQMYLKYEDNNVAVKG